MAEEKVENANGSLLDNMQNMGVDPTGKTANLVKGSQLGIGYQPTFIDAATPIVFPPVSLVVLQTPSMYDNTEHPAMGQMIKSIIEGHPKAVSGIDIGYTMDVSSQPAGHDGQEQEVPLQTKRTAPSPSFTFHEVTGNLIWNIFRKWMWDIHHPDTNTSMVDIADDAKKPFTMSAYSMSMIAIQFDPSLEPKNIIDAVFFTNMFPKETGELGLERTIGTSKVMERTIPFSAIAQHNEYTKALGKQIATNLNLAKVNYNKMKTGVSDVQSNLKDSGLEAMAIQALADSASLPGGSTA